MTPPEVIDYLMNYVRRVFSNYLSLESNLKLVKLGKGSTLIPWQKVITSAINIAPEKQTFPYASKIYTNEYKVYNNE